MTAAPNNKNFPEFYELCEAVIEERLTESQMLRLEALALSDAKLRLYYIEHVQQHLVLQERGMDHAGVLPAITDVSAFSPTVSSFPTKQSNFFYVVASVFVLSILAVTVYSVVSNSSQFYHRMSIIAIDESSGNSSDNNDVTSPTPRIPKTGLPFAQQHHTDDPAATFGQLIEMGKCEWETVDGFIVTNHMRVGQSAHLFLKNGISQVHFDNGVVLSLESPIRINLLNANRCFLRSGKLFAKVSPEGIGFTVETPVAAVEDLGTEFGVSVEDGQDAEIQVFTGRVDVYQNQSEQAIPITTGKRLRFTDEMQTPYNPNQLVHDVDQQKVFDAKANEAICPTTFGNGKEAFVLAGGELYKNNPRLKSDSDIFLLVKNTSDKNSAWRRKAYFTIDLSAVSTQTLAKAQLELAFGPTGVGFQSRLDEKTILLVYGLKDETGDFWEPNAITWENAPANHSGGSSVDQDQTVLLGKIEIRRNEDAGIQTISGDSLKQFLESDTNKLVTFIVVAETEEPLDMGYAHGFANRHHPELPPPTLRFFRDETK